MENNSKTNEVFNAGIAAAKSFEIDGVPAVLVPAGANVKTFEELTHRDRPQRTIANKHMRGTQQFLNYYNRFANEESTIYVDVDNAKFRAVIDHFGYSEDTDNGDHIVNYTCPETEEWQFWKKMDKQWMSQDDLSEFLQDHHLQIIKPSPQMFSVQEKDVVFDKLPDGAQMLEIAKTLSVNSDSAITSGKNMHNGAMKFEYNENINGVAGAKGEFEIPTYFVIGVELFKDGNAYLILCRFKYRKDGPKLSLRFEMVRPHKTHEHAVRDVIDQIQNGKLIEQDPEAESKTTTESGVVPGSKMKTGQLYEIV
jgi:uncharacterized protein YfdQ (DUF2303 family)